MRSRPPPPPAPAPPHVETRPHHAHHLHRPRGQVGGALAARLQSLGHAVTLAARDPHAESVRKALARNADMRVAEPLAAVHAADIVFLATPFAANGEALAPVTGALKGRCWSIAPTPSARA